MLIFAKKDVSLLPFCSSAQNLEQTPSLFIKRLQCMYEKKEYSFAGNTEELLSCCKRLQISLEEVASTVADKKTFTLHTWIFTSIQRSIS